METQSNWMISQIELKCNSILDKPNNAKINLNCFTLRHTVRWSFVRMELLKAQGV